MFDFFRNLGKSAAEKRQELINAYLDGELSAGEASRFEAELEQDPDLRAELAQLRQIKRALQQLPQVRAPRNYTLDPALYGAAPPAPTAQWLPALRVATALTAFFFILTVALDIFTFSGQAPPRSAADEAAVADVVVEEVEVEGEAVAVTQMVTEMAEEPVSEEVEMAEEAAQLAPPPTAEEAASAAAVEESEDQELADQVEEAAEAPLADEEAARATAAPAGAGGEIAPQPSPPIEEPVEADTRLMQVITPTATAAEALSAAEVATAEMRDQTAEPPAEEQQEQVPVRAEPLPYLRVAQVVLGILLAGLLVAWALARP